MGLALIYMNQVVVCFLTFVLLIERLQIPFARFHETLSSILKIHMADIKMSDEFSFLDDKNSQSHIDLQVQYYNDLEYMFVQLLLQLIHASQLVHLLV